MTLSRFIKLCRRHRHGLGITGIALTILPTCWFYLSTPWPTKQIILAKSAVLGTTVEGSTSSFSGITSSSTPAQESRSSSGNTSSGSSWFPSSNSNAASVPEPTSLLLMAPALLLLRRR